MRLSAAKKKRRSNWQRGTLGKDDIRQLGNMIPSVFPFRSIHPIAPVSHTINFPPTALRCRAPVDGAASFARALLDPGDRDTSWGVDESSCGRAKLGVVAACLVETPR